MKKLFSKKAWEFPLPAPDGAELITRKFSQADFIRQYYPSSHKIKDTNYYPDIWRYIDDPIYDTDGNDMGRTTRNLYCQKVPRFAFAYQQVIVLKHLVHLCGNRIQFDKSSAKTDKKTTEIINNFMRGWRDKNMEYNFYRFAKGVKITGDAALVFYIENGVFDVMPLSFFDGDNLYPHYGADGKLFCFARRYKEYNSDGSVVEKVEVWDKTMLYRLRTPDNPKDKTQRLVFGQGAYSCELDGYALESQPVIHGFKEVPVVYMRDNMGPAWHAAQESIDEYEMSFSHMAQNNKAFGEPILYLQGDNVAANHDINGTIKILTGGPDDKFGYLESQSASDSYIKQLNDLHDRIFEQAFIVSPPELKSGDLPAAALKTLYSPSIEKGMDDSQAFTPSLKEIVRLFAYGYGVENKATIDYANLPISAWIKVYVHVNESAIMNDLATGVQNKFLSRKTASERIPFYAYNEGEWERIVAEMKAAETQDILEDFENKRFGETE